VSTRALLTFTMIYISVCDKRNVAIAISISRFCSINACVDAADCSAMVAICWLTSSNCRITLSSWSMPVPFKQMFNSEEKSLQS
jgi:hypothetical protein